MALYGEVMAELLKRGIVHSGNNPIADMAERVVEGELAGEWRLDDTEERRRKMRMNTASR